MADSKQEEVTEVEFSPGGLLRQARETRNITIDEVAQQLRLTDSCIHDIEEDTYRSETPEAFYRGYVKNYAKFLGLDSDEFVQSFSHYVEKHNVYSSKGPSYTRTTSNYKKSKAPKIIANLLLSLVILGVAYLGYYFLYEKAYWNKMISGINGSNTGEISQPESQSIESSGELIVLPIEQQETNELSLDLDEKEVTDSVLEEAEEQNTQDDGDQ